jgi:hypothetical protein
MTFVLVAQLTRFKVDDLLQKLGTQQNLDFWKRLLSPYACAGDMKYRFWTILYATPQQLKPALAMCGGGLSVFSLGTGIGFLSATTKYTRQPCPRATEVFCGDDTCSYLSSIVMLLLKWVGEGELEGTRVDATADDNTAVRLALQNGHLRVVWALSSWVGKGELERDPSDVVAHSGSHVAQLQYCKMKSLGMERNSQKRTAK